MKEQSSFKVIDPGDSSDVERESQDAPLRLESRDCEMQQLPSLSLWEKKELPEVVVEVIPQLLPTGKNGAGVKLKKYSTFNEK